MPLAGWPGGRVAGQLYIAWCIAAISLPVLAGRLYDQTQGYDQAMRIAAGMNLLGALMALSLPATARSQHQSHPKCEPQPRDEKT
jgi:hypothetical protein